MRRLLTVLLTFLAVPAYAELTPSALGNDGELYSVHAGTCGELFPDGGACQARHAVVALDVVPAAGEADRLLVPETGDAEIESQPRLLYMPRSDTVLVLWHSQDAGGVRVDFVTLARGEWGDVASIAGGDGSAILMDRAPLTAVTRDAFDLVLGDGISLSAGRSVVHVLFQVAGATRYAPLLFVEGSYVGPATFDLGSSFRTATGDVERGAALTAGLAQAMNLQVADGRSVTVAFADASSRRLGVLEIELMPLEIELLGDYIRDQIYDRAELYDPGDVASFAGEIRAELIGVGHHLRLHPGIVEFASEQLGSWLETSASDYGFAGFEDLGRDAGELAMYLTASVTASVVHDPATGDDILEIELGDFLASLEAESPFDQLLQIDVLASLPAPQIGAGTAALFPSRDGRDLLVGWKPETKNRVFYVESRAGVEGGAWSERRSLRLSSGLTLADAIQLLSQKIR